MHKFYKITLVTLLAGLIITGVGCAVTVLEMNSLKYMGNKYANAETTYTPAEIELPDNLGKVFYTEEFIKKETDNSLPYNKIIVELGHRADYSIENQPSVEENLYLYNYNNGNYSEYPVNRLTFGWSAHNNDEEFEIFRTVLADLKNREIYSYDRSYSVDIVVKGSEETLERLELLPEEYEFRNIVEVPDTDAASPEIIPFRNIEEVPDTDVSSFELIPE